jgi:dTDP-4-dehydrorhamnose reductase
MRMLLLGKDGQVGRALEQRLWPLGELVACGRTTANLVEPDALTGLVERVQPDFIINAAAYTAVDKAESDAAGARLVNAEAVAALGASALGVMALPSSIRPAMCFRLRKSQRIRGRTMR